MKINAEKIKNVLFWVTIAILIFLFAWYFFGNNPTIEQISFALTLLFLFFAWDERKSRRIIGNKLDKLDKLDDIYLVLKSMVKK